MGVTRRFQMEFSSLTYEVNQGKTEVARAREWGARMMSRRPSFGLAYAVRRGF
jgi:hypothetical protein